MITQMERKTKDDPLTRQIIGCAFEVHRALGPGFPERVYRTALATSLTAAGLSVEPERRFKVTFQKAIVGEFQVDLFVGGRAVVEVKAIIGTMPKVFGAQVLAYLKAADVPVGLLVNFGNTSCQVRRFSLSSAKSPTKSAESPT